MCDDLNCFLWCDELIENLNEISLFTQAYFTMLTIIHTSKNYQDENLVMNDDLVLYSLHCAQCAPVHAYLRWTKLNLILVMEEVRLVASGVPTQWVELAAWHRCWSRAQDQGCYLSPSSSASASALEIATILREFFTVLALEKVRLWPSPCWTQNTYLCFISSIKNLLNQHYVC